MKLRNKKTGEIVELSIYGIEVHIRKEEQPFYHSLAELNDEWEDYKPKEPYIKDESVAKLVMDWARLWGIKMVKVQLHSEHDEIDLVGWIESSARGKGIDIPRNCVRDGLVSGDAYTITELCGEEEE